MQWTEEHESIRETVAKFIDNEIKISGNINSILFIVCLPH